MRRFFEFMSANAAELMYAIAFFLIAYLIARLLKAPALAAAGFATLPLALLYVAQNPHTPTAVLAFLR